MREREKESEKKCGAEEGGVVIEITNLTSIGTREVRVWKEERSNAERGKRIFR